MHLSLAGQNGWPTAQRLCLPHRELPMGADNPLPRLTLELTRRFPNPIPSGIHVPQWALLDVTVRYKVFLCST